MKTILSFLVFAITGPSSQTAEIIFSDRRDEDSFKRISEHLTGKENPGRYAIARTDPSQRNGYYVALKLENKDQARNAASIRIHFVGPGSQDIETKTIAIQPIKKKRALVGLTDGIWSSSDTNPTAWKIEILDINGTILSSSQSFLWSSVSA
tara:strand:- start:514 stop:969 length:456 start_codon:yes stop_codon:yes gene_type:complete